MFKKILIWMQGRHTFFAFLELALGTALAWFHRLDMSYVALVGTIQGMVLGHSIKEDWFEKKNGGDTGGSSAGQ
ncbi:MAG: hypothetical protein C5B59_08575 [Bacteroidetes bacterium]|nr:MAG: hypothetical protein C5B59_08575 [Bacteroidota bacterium]